MSFTTATNKEAEEDKDQIISLLNKAFACRTNNLKQSIEFAQSALSLSKRIDDKALIARSLSLLSLFYMMYGDNQNTLRTGEEAITYFQELNDEKGIADAKYNIAGVYYKIDSHHLALINLIDCIAIYRKFNDQNSLARSHKWLGTIYEHFGDEKNAIAAYDAAIKSAQLLGDLYLESNIYNLLSGIYLKQNNIEKASELIERATAMKQQTGDTGGLAFSYYGRGKVNLAKKDFKEAESDFEEAIRIHLFMGEMLGMGLGYHKIAKLHIQIGQLQKAKTALTNGIALATQHSITTVKYKCYFLFYQIFKLENDTVNALHYLELYYQQKERVVKPQPAEEIVRSEPILPREHKKDTPPLVETAEIGKTDFTDHAVEVKQDDLLTVTGHDVEPPLPTIVNYEVDPPLTTDMSHEAETPLPPDMSYEVETPLKPVVSQEVETPLTSVIKHEVETPLPPETTSTPPVIEKVENVEKQLEEAAKSSASNLPPVINDGPAISIFDAGDAALEIRQSDLKKLLENIKNTYDGPAREKGLRLNLNVHYTVGDYYQLDENKLRQIIGNLVKNAIKFTDAGQIDINVRKVSGDDNADKVRFEIMDTGVGIEKDRLETIFNKSFSGNGLATVKKLVELHSSTLNVNSTAGRGSVFYFDLTLKRTNSPGKPVAKQLDSLHGKTVLLAEDNMINAMLARKLLSNWKIVTDHAENGRIAVEKSKLKVYDFVLMDIQMPEMDGFEATSHIRSSDNINHNTPVFALTAGVSTEMQEKYSELFNGFLGKPIQIDKLQEAFLTVY